MDLAKLREEFPPEVLEKKQGYDYVPHPYVIERLNSALGEGGWDFDVLWHEWIRDLDTIVILGQLTAYIDGQRVTKQQFGGQLINKTRTGAIVDISNDYKGACSDALRKCATLLGVGLELYMDKPAKPVAVLISTEQVERIMKARGERVDGWKTMATYLAEKGMPSLEGLSREQAGFQVAETLNRLTAADATALLARLERLPMKEAKSNA